jgi:hypothetical protein
MKWDILEFKVCAPSHTWRWAEYKWIPVYVYICSRDLHFTCQLPDLCLPAGMGPAGAQVSEGLVAFCKNSDCVYCWVVEVDTNANR